VGGDIDKTAIDQGTGHGDMRQITGNGLVASAERSVHLALRQGVRLGGSDGTFLGRLQADRYHRSGMDRHGSKKGSGGCREIQFHVSLS